MRVKLIFFLIFLLTLNINVYGKINSFENENRIGVSVELSKNSMQPMDRRLLADGVDLPAGKYALQALVQLPTLDQSNVIEKLTFGISKEKKVTYLTPSPNRNSGFKEWDINAPTNLDQDFFNADTLLVAYRGVLPASQCSSLVTFEAREAGFNNSFAIPIDLYLKTYSRRISVEMNSKNIVQRDYSYLLNRSLGFDADDDWRYVEEKFEYAYMRRLNLDLRSLDSIDIVVDKSTKLMNFRISRSPGGRPTDVILWEDIPKKIEEKNGVLNIHLDMARAIDLKMPGALNSEVPLTLLEISAFVPKKYIANVADHVPVHKFIANYIDAKSKDVVTKNYPALLEKVGSNIWQWRVNLTDLQNKYPLGIQYLGGTIAEKKEGCIEKFLKIELVRHEISTVPSFISDFKNSNNRSNANYSTKELAFKDYLSQNKVRNWYKLKIKNNEYHPKLSSESFWQNYVDGKVWVSYGDIYWAGGSILPNDIDLEAGQISFKQINFIYQARPSEEFQDWFTSLPASDEGSFDFDLSLILLAFLIALLIAVHYSSYRVEQFILATSRELKSLLKMLNVRFNYIKFYYLCLLKILWGTFNFLLIFSMCYELIYFYERPVIGFTWVKFQLALIFIIIVALLNILHWRSKNLNRELLNETNIERIIMRQVQRPLAIWAVILIAAFSISLAISGHTYSSEYAVSSTNNFFSVVPWIWALIFSFISLCGFFANLSSIVAKFLQLVVGIFFSSLKFILKPQVMEIFLSLVIYSIAVIYAFRHGKNNALITYANICGVFLLKNSIVNINEFVRNYRISNLSFIYISPGGLYFAVTFLGLLITPLLYVMGLEFFAQQMMTVTYFSLAIAVLIQFINLKRD